MKTITTLTALTLGTLLGSAAHAQSLPVYGDVVLGYNDNDDGGGEYTKSATGRVVLAFGGLEVQTDLQGYNVSGRLFAGSDVRSLRLHTAYALSGTTRVGVFAGYINAIGTPANVYNLAFGVEVMHEVGDLTLEGALQHFVFVNPGSTFSSNSARMAAFYKVSPSFEVGGYVDFATALTSVRQTFGVSARYDFAALPFGAEIYAASSNYVGSRYTRQIGANLIWEFGPKADRRLWSQGF